MMASSLFGNKPLGTQTPKPSNNLMQMVSQFNQFKQQLGGQDPKAIVEQMLQSGQMSREQFNQFSQMANQLSGLLK